MKETLEDIKNHLGDVVEVQVRIKPDALADKVFDLAVDPLMVKLLKLIPTEFDDALYASNKENLRKEFAELLAKGLILAEEATGVELDGKE